jgi:glycosyl transferase family 25
MFDFIERVVYINLAHRTDRRSQIEAELACFGDRVERFDAIRHTHGGLGCSKSHLAVLERAKAQGWRNVLIVEDDFTWVALGCEKSAPRFTEIAAGAYDVILIAAAYAKHDPVTLRVQAAQTTTCYLVAEHYYDTLIANYKESIEQLEKTMNYGTYALDQWWKRLQPSGLWFIMRPTMGVQRPSYSDIEHKVVDYRLAFLRNG